MNTLDSVDGISIGAGWNGGSLNFDPGNIYSWLFVISEYEGFLNR